MAGLHRVALSASFLLAGGACDYVALSFDGSMGLVVIIISDDRRPSPGGYRIRTHQVGVPDRFVFVASGEEFEIEAASPDPLELTLFAPSNCRVVGRNPQVVTPTPEHTVRAGFAVECAGVDG